MIDITTITTTELNLVKFMKTDAALYLANKYNLSHDNFSTYTAYLFSRDILTDSRINNLQSPVEAFQKYPFCQNRRWMDRESQAWLIANKNYTGNYPISDAFFRLIFRKYSTYSQVMEVLGDFPSNVIYTNYSSVLKTVQSVEVPFTGAYLVPHRDKEFTTKVEGWLNLFTEYNFESLGHIKTAKECYEYLKKIKGFGDFLAMQFVAELSWLSDTQFKYNEFVIPGNGAVRGLNKLGVAPKRHVEFLHDLQDTALIDHPLWGKLYCMDYQNTFCEFDKFTRLSGNFDNGGRTRMKRNRKPHHTPIKEFIRPEME